MQQNINGFGLLCTPEGEIVTVYREEYDQVSQIVPGYNFTEFIHETDRYKAGEFLQQVSTRGLAAKFALHTYIDDEILLFYYTGVKQGTVLLITGVTQETGFVKTCDELLEINNVQINSHRDIVSGLIKVPLHKEISPESELFELSRVNNELVNTRRELVKRNVELAQLITQQQYLLGMAAHDLRNPLGIIHNFCEFLREDNADTMSEESMGFLEMIGSSSISMLHLIDDMLDYTAISTGNLHLHLESGDLTECMLNNLKTNRILARQKNISLVFTPPTGPVNVKFDKRKIDQVLSNFIGNAVKYSDPGTEVVVSVEIRNEEACVSITDHGIGIRQEDLTKLFNAFTVTGNKPTAGEKSTGLGLLIVKRVIDEHCGRVWVESTQGKGSTFYFSLPLVENRVIRQE